MLENTFAERCTITRLCSIEEKLDLIIKMLGDANGIKGFGLSVAANIVGNLIDGSRS